MNAQAVIKELDGLLKISAAAAFLGVSPQTLRNWDEAERLCPVRHPVTGYRYYRKEDLTNFLKKVGKERGKR